MMAAKYAVGLLSGGLLASQHPKSHQFFGKVASQLNKHYAEIAHSVPLHSAYGYSYSFPLSLLMYCINNPKTITQLAAFASFGYAFLSSWKKAMNHEGELLGLKIALNNMSAEAQKELCLVAQELEADLIAVETSLKTKCDDVEKRILLHMQDFQSANAEEHGKIMSQVDDLQAEVQSRFVVFEKMLNEAVVNNDGRWEENIKNLTSLSSKMDEYNEKLDLVIQHLETLALLPEGFGYSHSSRSSSRRGSAASPSYPAYATPPPSLYSRASGHPPSEPSSPSPLSPPLHSHASSDHSPTPRSYVQHQRGSAASPFTSPLSARKSLTGLAGFSTMPSPSSSPSSRRSSTSAAGLGHMDNSPPERMAVQRLLLTRMQEVPADQN